ncbi:MAG: hypothetical protein ABI912_03855 [Actinomycetota bacterium]
MSQDDPFGVPLNPPGFEPRPPGFEPLASGDESVLASSGLVADPAAPRNKTALIALGLAVVIGAAGVAVATGVFKGKAKPKKPAVTAKPSSSSSAAATPSPSTSTVAPTPKPTPVAIKAIAGKVQPISKANSGTLGLPYTVTLPAKWTIARAVRNDAIANGDLRMRNAEKTHSLTISTIKPATAAGQLTAPKIAAIRTALLKGDAAAKPLAGTPRASVAGGTATGYDVSTISAGKPITARTIVWQHGGTTYVAVWRAPAAAFRASLKTFAQLLAAIKFAG